MWGCGARLGVATPRAAVAGALAVLAMALAFAAAAPNAAWAGTGIGGAPQCDDNFDNDLDLKVDHDGMSTILGKLPPDPHCDGPTDDSEQAASACPICANFVTTWDPDGAGGVQPRTRAHNNLIANLPYAIDVDTNRAPLVGGLPLPGYELKVTVTGTSAQTPTIRIEKLASAPVSLPVRIEVVVGDVAKTSFGYDQLDATAPASFNAAINLTDRDGNPATSQASVALSIGGAPERLTLVTEQFGGNPAAARTDRHIRRITFRGDAAAGTQVPTAASADLTLSERSQHVALTRNEPTTLEFELDEPGDGTDARGTVDQLPQTAAVALADVDLNGDDALDNSIAFEGSAGVGQLDVHIDSAKTEKAPDGTTTVVGRQTVDAEVTDLPAVAGITYADTEDSTQVTYNSEGRATRAEIRTDDGERQFEATLENLPENILGLTHFTNATGGSVEYSADGVADHAHVFSKEGPKELEVDVDGLPMNIPELSYDTPEGLLDIHYEADSTAPHVNIRTQDLIEPGPPDPGEEPTPNHVREMNVAADGVPGELDFTLDTTDPNGELLADWFASATLPEIRVTGTDEVPFFQRATDLDLLIEELPRTVSARVRDDLIRLDAEGDQIGRVELLGSRAGDTERLPENADGLLMRDTDTRYVLFARVRGLRDFTYSKETSSSLDVLFDASPPAGTVARLDSAVEVTDTVWDNAPDDEGGEVERDGLDVTQLVLPEYPADVDLHIDTGNEVQGTDGEIEVDYSAASTGGPLSFGNVVQYEGDPVPIVYGHEYVAERLPASLPASDFNSELFATLTPTPQEFHVCKVAGDRGASRGDNCAETINPDGTESDIFTDGLFEDFDPDTEANAGSTSFSATPRTRFTLDQHETKPLEIAYMRRRDEVDDAGDECENPLLNFFCRYADVKPGLETANIDLELGELAIQAHLESSGWVGDNIADLFAEGDNQGYIAMDTGWRGVESLSGETLCAALGRPGYVCTQSPVGGGCDGLPPDCGALFGLHGHRPPPAEVQTEGLLSKGGDRCTESEDCEVLLPAFPFGFAGKIDPVAFNYGTDFGASTRVFEFDPDELIFAKHFAGHIYCGVGTDLRNGSTDVGEHLCSREIELPPE